MRVQRRFIRTTNIQVMSAFHGQSEKGRILCHANGSITTAGRAVTAAEAMKLVRLLAIPSDRLNRPQRVRR